MSESNKKFEFGIAGLLISAIIGGIATYYFFSGEIRDCEDRLVIIQTQYQDLINSNKICNNLVQNPVDLDFKDAKQYCLDYHTYNPDNACAYQLSRDMVVYLYSAACLDSTIGGFRGYYGKIKEKSSITPVVVYRNIDKAYNEMGDNESTYAAFIKPSGGTTSRIDGVYYDPCPPYCDRSAKDPDKDKCGFK